MNNTIVYGINRVIVCAAISAAVFSRCNGATLQPLAAPVDNDAAICLVTMTAPRNRSRSVAAAYKNDYFCEEVAGWFYYSH